MSRKARATYEEQYSPERKYRLFETSTTFPSTSGGAGLPITICHYNSRRMSGSVRRLLWLKARETVVSLPMSPEERSVMDDGCPLLRQL
jgi:hypothetical protein